jgi:hypothetical protein
VTTTQGPGTQTYRWRGVTPRGRQQSGCITLPPGGLAAHVDALFRAGWRYLLICSGPGPVPPRFGEENQVAGIDKHPDTGKRTGWWGADKPDPAALSPAAVAVFPPGCNYDVTRAPAGQRGDTGCLHHYAEHPPGCICPAWFDSAGWHLADVNPACTAHAVPATAAGNDRPRFKPADQVVLLRGSRSAVILREVKPDRSGRRYNVRRDDGRVGTSRERDLRFVHETWEQRWSGIPAPQEG